jgi:hypothetical protein
MRRNWLKKQLSTRVVVYTTEEQTLDGVLDIVAADGLVLLDTRVRSDGDVTLAGLVYVPRDKVRIVQIP